MGQFTFDNREEFIEKLRNLVSEGIPGDRISTVSPYHVHEVDEILGSKPSVVRVFALFGAIAGLITGFAFTIYTVKVWPLMSGGKPFVSIPAFLIIAFALTILFGSLSSFVGFLLAARLPALRKVVSREEFTNRFEILVEEDE